MLHFISLVIEMNQKALKALSDPSRLRIVQFLSNMCCGRAAVDDDGGVYDGPSASEVCFHLTGAEKINSTVSHHLHELEDAGLIQITRSGKKMICTLNSEALKTLSDELLELSKGNPDVNC